MATTASGRPDLGHLEASCIRAQSDMLQDLASDISYAAKIFNYKVYDFQGRSIAREHGVWKGKSEHEHYGEKQSEEDELRAKELVRDSQMVVDFAEQVKAGLKSLIQILCKDTTVVNVNAGPEDTGIQRQAIANVDLESRSLVKVEKSPSLEDQLTSELGEARRVYTDTSKFSPVNFRATTTTTPIQNPTQIDNTQQQVQAQQQQKRIRNTQVIDEKAMLNCQSATNALQHIIHASPRRGRGRPPESKNKSNYHATIPLEVSSRSSVKEQEKILARSRSPAPVAIEQSQCSMKEMEKELLTWIPKKIAVPRLPVDLELQALFRQEASERHEDEWAY